MGRTVPSFRIVLAEEKAEWKPFRNALDKSERKEFDEMFDIPKLYISACSNSVQLVPLHPIIISILFHHYKELREYINEVEQMEITRIRNNLFLGPEDDEEEEQPILDNYFIGSKKIAELRKSIMFRIQGFADVYVCVRECNVLIIKRLSFELLVSSALLC
jgi:hypothetical protein